MTYDTKVVIPDHAEPPSVTGKVVRPNHSTVQIERKATISTRDIYNFASAAIEIIENDVNSRFLTAGERARLVSAIDMMKCIREGTVQ